MIGTDELRSLSHSCAANQIQLPCRADAEARNRSAAASGKEVTLPRVRAHGTSLYTVTRSLSRILWRESVPSSVLRRKPTMPVLPAPPLTEAYIRWRSSVWQRASAPGGSSRGAMRRLVYLTAPRGRHAAAPGPMQYSIQSPYPLLDRQASCRQRVPDLTCVMLICAIKKSMHRLPAVDPQPRRRQVNGHDR